MSKHQFKDAKTFDERKNEAEKKVSEHPEFIPLIVEPYKNSSLPELDKKKYLANADLKLGDFYSSISKKFAFKHKKAVFFFLGDKTQLGQFDNRLKDVYNQNKNDDGFLYVEYSEFEVFG